MFKNSITFQANSNYQSAQNQETFAGLPSLRQYRIPDFRSRRSYHEINPRAFLNAEKVCNFLVFHLCLFSEICHHLSNFHIPIILPHNSKQNIFIYCIHKVINYTRSINFQRRFSMHFTIEKYM